MKQLLAALVVLALIIAWTSPAPAQDPAMKTVQKTTKDAEKLTQSKSEPGKVKSVSCGPECGFSISSRDDKELVSAVQSHVKTHHGKDVSAEQVMKMATTEGEKK
jgi:predicted small metal-binding protein